MSLPVRPMSDTVRAEAGAPMPPRGVPRPFSLGPPGQLAGLLSDAGLSADVYLFPGQRKGWGLSFLSNE